MGYIIVTRNPKNEKALVITNHKEELVEFQTEDAACEAASHTTVCKAWGYQVVEID